MEALVEYEAGVCACGYHESQKDGAIKIEEKSCPFCAGITRWGRLQSERDAVAHEALKRKHGEKIPATEPLPADGRKTYSRLLSDAEAEAEAKKRG